MRFISQDSYRGEQTQVNTWHLYAYCVGNPINRVDPSGHNSYIFTLSEFKNEAPGIKKVVKNHYGKNAHIKTTNSYKQLKKKWNKMRGKIDSVIINSHGGPSGLSIASKSSQIKKLKKKNVKRLILLGCNTGHQDYSFSNTAFHFNKRVRGTTVASDGTVYGNAVRYRKFDTYDSKPDGWWESIRNNAPLPRSGKRRESNYGWVVYNKSNTAIKLSKENNLTIKQLLMLKF